MLLLCIESRVYIIIPLFSLYLKYELIFLPYILSGDVLEQHAI